MILMKNIQSIFLDALEKETSRKRDMHGWEGGIFREILNLPIDNRGEVGEEFVATMLRLLGKEIIHERGIIDRKNKQWDIIADNIRLEIKTATLGKSAATFQHENLERNRDWDGLILVDVAPNTIYVKCEAKINIDWSRHHKRVAASVIKYDISLKKAKQENLEVKTLADFSRMYENMVASIKKL